MLGTQKCNLVPGSISTNFDVIPIYFITNCKIGFVTENTFPIFSSLQENMRLKKLICITFYVKSKIQQVDIVYPFLSNVNVQNSSLGPPMGGVGVRKKLYYLYVV